MKRILLLNPHEAQQLGFSPPPLGLLYLAGLLQCHGFEVRVTDACLEGKAAAAKALREFRPAIVGITCLTPGRKKALELAKLAKDYDPSITVVLGGAHPTIMYQQILTHYPFVDAVVLGEGEHTLLELAQGKDFSHIKGLAYRSNQTVVKTAARAPIADLDTLPFPAWNLVQLGKYPARGQGVFRGINLEKEPRVPVIFSRGCKGHCDFCSTWWIWKGWRHRSARNMVDELEMLCQHQGARHFCFADDALTIDRQATIHLCDEILARKLQIAFHITTRTDCVDEVMLHKLHAAGCYQVAFGIESGSQRLLDRMGKENNLANAENAIRLAKAAGLQVTALMIIGNVGETRETVAETVAFLKRTQPTDIGCVGGLWVLPGTKLHQHCKNKNFITDEFWLGDEPYKTYTLEWPLRALTAMQEMVTNYRSTSEARIESQLPAISSPPDRFLQKWHRYVHPEVNEYSATTEWKDAQEQHTELMAYLPAHCRNVLDLGCGDGWSTHRLLQLGKHAIGLTINPKEAEHARNTYGIELAVGDMHDLQFADATFDGIYSRESYEHTVAPYVAMCEMNRVLRPNGYALINLPWDEWIREDSHYSVFSPAQMREMLYKCRFVVEREGRTARGHFWYLARKVAEVGAPHPFPPPVVGKQWLNGQVINSPAPSTAPGKPRVIAMLRIKNEQTWILPTLEKASPMVDGFVILDDGSTDRTPELCRSHPKVLCYEYQKEQGVDEVRDKNLLLQRALDQQPDWILALDGDELFEDAAPALVREAISNCPAEVSTFGFNFLYMWDTHDRFRVDGKYANLKHPRLFKVTGLNINPRSLVFRPTQHGANFHCGSVPANLPGQVQYLDVSIKHYGYFEKEQRARKKAFYTAQDPQNAAKGYYDHLTDETGIKLLPWHERTGVARQPTGAPPAQCCEVPSGTARLNRAPIDQAATQTSRPGVPLANYYLHRRSEIIAAVPETALSILDVGCAGGVLGQALKELLPHRHVVGIEQNPAAAAHARQYLDAVYETSLESFEPPFTPGEFDCLVFADILEHLTDPWGILHKLLRFLKPGGTLIASVPNVRRLTVLHHLADLGQWQYQEEGIQDRTHLRFFTKSTFSDLLRQEGIEHVRVSNLNGGDLQQFAPSKDGVVRMGRLALLNVAAEEFQELSALQFLFIGTYAATGLSRHGDAKPVLTKENSQTAPLASECSLLSEASLADVPKLLSDNTLPGETQPACCVRLAAKEAEAGRVEPSLKLLQAAQTLFSLSSELVLEVAGLLAQLGRFDDATSLLATQAARTPKDPNIHLGLGILLLNQNRKPEAVASLFEVQRLDPANAAAARMLASILIDLNRGQEALPIVQALLRTEPKDPVLLLALAGCLVQDDKLEAAIATYRQVLELEPANAVAKQTLEELESVRQASLPSNLQTPPTQTDEKRLPTVAREQFQAPLRQPAGPEPTPGAKPQASILMLCYNKVELTKKCIQALQKNTPEALYELIIVDNASTDGTSDFLIRLEQESKNIQILANSENLGFVGGNNAAARLATTENLVFLNNDTEPQPGWLEALLQAIETDPQAGAAGAKLVYPNGRLQEAGGIIFSDASGWNYGRGQDPRDPRFNFVREVDYCSGACLLVRRHLFEAAGGFDPRFAPAYYEDTDLCFQLRQGGWRVLYQPASVVVHHEGGTAGTSLQGGFKRYQLVNRDKFRAKWQAVLPRQFPPGAASVAQASDRRPGKRILVLDALLPMFDRASGSRRTWEMLRLLSAAGHKVTLIARNGDKAEVYAGALQQMGIETYAGDPDRMRQLGFQCEGWRFDFPALLQERQFDKALLSFWYVAEQYLPWLNRHSPRTMLYIDTVDVHYVRELRQAELEGNAQLLAAAKERKARELSVYQRADTLITVTPNDAAALRRELPSSTLKIIPNIHAAAKQVPPFSERKGLLFVGNFAHPPNQDAILFFHQTIWPLLCIRLPGVELTIVGNNPPPAIQALAGTGITVTGYVPEVEPYLHSRRVSVAPLRYGAGMKGKIGEALAGGLPVVTTSIGAEGMMGEGAPPFMVEDTPEAFADAVVRLYLDERAWSDYSARGQRHMAQNFSPAIVGRQLDELVRQPALVSIIMLTLNGLADTRLCLESIGRHTTFPYELILVDNGSTDGTVRFLRHYAAKHPHVRLILNQRNRGFAGGNNQALAIARGDYVVLLNNDTVVTAKWLEGMLQVFDQHPEAGIVGPRSNYVVGAQLVPEVDYHSLEELPAFAERWRQAHAGQSAQINRVIGFCLMASRPVLEKIGGLDEAFINGNFEDDDFCLRAAGAGFTVRMAQEVFIHHTGSRTFHNLGMDYKRNMLANWKVFKAKWGIPENAPIDGGYRFPLKRAAGQPLFISPGQLEASCEPDALAVVWTDKSRRPSAGPAPVHLPPCGRVGHLGPARDLLGRNKPREAWEATLAALQRRPFHPEAYLLLGEIAASVGDGPSARACAEQARRLAPGFKPARKFLNRRLSGSARPNWLTLPEAVRNPNTQPQPRLSVCLITKNEERFLGQCLQSIRELAHQIVVVDTGSTDRTVALAQEHGAEVHHFAWCDDFSAARNAALEHVTGDWVLVLDADEELAAKDRDTLRAHLNDTAVISWRLPLLNAGRESVGFCYVPRLFRNAPGLFFLGRIHEQIFSSVEVRRAEWGLESRLGEATLLHHGYTPEVMQERKKVERNLALLEQAVLELPDQPHLLMNLGLELSRSGREAEGLERYRQAFQAMAAQPPAQVTPEGREMLLIQFSTRLLGARQFEELVGVLTSPLARLHRGLSASLHFALGMAQMELGQLPQAIEHLEACLTKRTQPSLAPVYPEVGSAAPYRFLALCHARLGQAAAAEKAFQHGLKEQGPLDKLRLDFARFLLEQNRPVEALQPLHEAVSENALDVAAWRLGGQIALSRAEFLEFARDWTHEAIAQLPEDDVLTVQRGEVLLLSQDAPGARPLWERLWNNDRHPVALAALILCELVQGVTPHAPQNEMEAVPVTRAFLEWYRKCVNAGARAVVMALNARTAELRGVLPEAARILEAVNAEAGRPAPAEACVA